MVGLNKIYKIYLLLFLLVSPFAFGQTTDINFDEIRVNGSLGPYEFCQGEVPNFQLRFRLTSGSTTLTLTSTNTLEITANGSGSNIFSKTVDIFKIFYFFKKLTNHDTSNKRHQQYPTGGYPTRGGPGAASPQELHPRESAHWRQP